MKKSLLTVSAIFIMATLQAQVEPTAGTWKTWFIKSAKEYRLPAPSSYKEEIAQVVERQQKLDSAMSQQVLYWNAGAPGYRWQDLATNLYVTDTSQNGKGVMVAMLLGVAVYDAMIAAWDSKYAYNRPRPFAADKRIKALVLKPDSPSYPCEHSVTAGVVATIIAHFYPSLADSIHRMAKQQMESRIIAGVAFPSDTRAGFELGKKIAEKEIEYTKDFLTKTAWDRKIPEGTDKWKGKFAMFPMAGFNKTAVLESSSQFRPAPPPDFAKDMAELKNFKQTFRSMNNAFYWASQSFWENELDKKIFELNIHLNPPRAARLHAITSVAMYDGFVACWDAKFAYWGIRPNQYDTTFRPALLIMPPFPGYPSGHATVSGVMGELYSYLFPENKTMYRQKAKDAAESRFQAGIHFRTDNEVGLDMGKKVAGVIIQKLKADGITSEGSLTQQKQP